MTTTVLDADAVAFALSTVAAGNALYTDDLGLTLGFPDVALQRNYTVSTSLIALRLDRISIEKIVEPGRGVPSQRFQHLWRRHCESIEDAINSIIDQVNAIQAAYDAAAQATAAASEANNAAEEVRETVATVEADMEELKAGTLVLPAINVGGDPFVNDGGSLVSLQ